MSFGSYGSGIGNGLVILQGLQTNIAQGSAGIGPYSIACAPFGASVLCPDDATTTVPVPGGLGVPLTGVIVTTSDTAGMTCKVGFISGQLTYINPNGLPSMWTFDPDNVPSDVYVQVSNTSGAFAQVQFF